MNDGALTLKMLEGKPFWGFNRAANMSMFQFGSSPRVADRGNPKQVGELALHVQCAWRISQRDAILVGSRDLHYPSNYHLDETVPAEFDWSRDPNRLDTAMRAFMEDGNHGYVVDTVNLTRAGSIVLDLNDACSLEVFPDDSLESEHWRLLRPGIDTPHLVFAGRGIVHL